jgi:hypothetical protein
MQWTFNEVVLALGAQSVFLGFVGWLVRSIISHGLERDLAAYQAQLRTDSDREIERLKNEFRMAELEHKVRFSKLHEKRAEVIANIYGLMVESNWYAQRYAYTNRLEGQMDAVAEAAKEKITELSRYFELHRLYLPNSICIVLNQFVSKMHLIVSALGIYFPGQDEPSPTRKQQSEKMEQIAKAFETELPAVKSLLESEFRTLLGATDEEWLIPAR